MANDDDNPSSENDLRESLCVLLNREVPSSFPDHTETLKKLNIERRKLQKGRPENGAEASFDGDEQNSVSSLANHDASSAFTRHTERMKQLNIELAELRKESTKNGEDTSFKDVIQKSVSSLLNDTTLSSLMVLTERLKKQNIEMRVMRERWGQKFGADNALLAALYQRVLEVCDKKSEGSGKQVNLDARVEEQFGHVQEELSRMGSELVALRTVLKGEALQFAKVLKDIGDAIDSINEK